MTIKTQKWILFIPFVNLFVIIFQWLRLYFRHPIPKVGILKVLLKIFLCSVVITILEIILDKMVSNVTAEQVIYFISSYLTMIMYCYIPIKDQERYYNHQ